jgi:hypothetical protein
LIREEGVQSIEEDDLDVLSGVSYEVLVPGVNRPASGVDEAGQDERIDHGHSCFERDARGFIGGFARLSEMLRSSNRVSTDTAISESWKTFVARA